jgi:hypothetical protein
MASFEKNLTTILDFNLKKLPPLYQALCVMLCFTCFICFVMYSSNEVRISKSRYRDMFKNNFSGIVVKKYLDSNNRKSPTFKFKDSSKFNGYRLLWNKADIGDSISKKAKSRFVKIFKKDTVIVFDMNIEFKYHDTLPENEQQI